MAKARKTPSAKRQTPDAIRRWPFKHSVAKSTTIKPLFTLPPKDHAMLMANIEYGSIKGHWLYTGFTNKGGYGVYLWNAPDGHRYFINVHRYVWEHYYGKKIKRGYELDHLCHVTNCCRPMKPHLEEVTKSVNLSRRRFN